MSILFLALSALAFPAMGQTKASDCGPDVWEKLFSRPGTATEEYGKLLAKVKRGMPPTPEEREILFKELLELPDPSTDAARTHLKQIDEQVWEWKMLPPITPSARRLEKMSFARAISLRKLLAGGPNAFEESGAAVGCIQYDSNWFPESAGPVVWQQRIESALIKHGEQNRWKGDNSSTPPEPFYRSPIEVTVFGGPPTTPSTSPKGEDGVRTTSRAIYGNVIKALALNPSAKNHQLALHNLVLAADYLHRSYLEVPDEELNYPIGIVQALIGYLNPKTFPPEKRDPKIESKIRELLPKMRIRFDPDHFDEYPPRTERHSP
jgi:hypothetical protein